MINLKNCVLGMELGSTRIKAVLVDENHEILAAGSHQWENRLEHGIWTYHLEDIREGVQYCYRKLAEQVREEHGQEITTLGAIGISAMMHGYMVFDKAGELLSPFRTWRNTMTEEAADKLTEAFDFHIPQRWSIAHLYHSIINNEEHVKDIDYMTTLEGYIHWLLTGEKVLGIGECAGMFPVDSTVMDFDGERIAVFDDLVAEKGYPWKLKDILPKCLVAGEDAGRLTEAGARFLDPVGHLKPGVLLCPPEGDAGTGMVATNSVSCRTGNVSAGTSVFAMVVLEKQLSKMHREIDMVTTPAGDPVAMAHSNNCTSDLNAWVGLFEEFACGFGMNVEQGELFGFLFKKALEGKPDGGGLLSYNYVAGEEMTGHKEGRPLFVRLPKAQMNLANFMRVQLMGSLTALKVGMNILMEQERVGLDRMTGHGGFFKTEKVGQKIMAAALGVPVDVMETAGEGGAYGIALLAAYMLWGQKRTLAEYLAEEVFSRCCVITEYPEKADVNGFEQFMKYFSNGLSIEDEAIARLV